MAEDFGIDLQAARAFLAAKGRAREEALDRRSFSEISDIDIALGGLPDAETYFAILGEAMRMTSFPLDLVELEKIGAENASHIREYGRPVYERPRNATYPSSVAVVTPRSARPPSRRNAIPRCSSY